MILLSQIDSSVLQYSSHVCVEAQLAVSVAPNVPLAGTAQALASCMRCFCCWELSLLALL